MTASMIVHEAVPLSEIIRSPDVFPRVGVDMETVAAYAEHFEDGAAFPPIEVVRGEDGLILVDGWHRVLAAERAGKRKIRARIFPGTMRDAVQMALSMNATHGLRRTNADKNHVVERVLRDSEWGKWTDGTIARRCALSQTFVSKVRRKLGLTQHGAESPSEAGFRYQGSEPIKLKSAPRLTMRGDKVVMVETVNNGRRPAAQRAEPAATPAESPPGQITAEQEQEAFSLVGGGPTPVDLETASFLKLAASLTRTLAEMRKLDPRLIAQGITTPALAEIDECLRWHQELVAAIKSTHGGLRRLK